MTNQRIRGVRPLRLGSVLRAAVALLPALAWACAPAGEGPPTESVEAVDEAGGTAVIALSGDIVGVNPLVASSQATREIHNQIFLRLLEEQADYAEHPPTFEPELAESWEWSDEGKTLTLHLRHDAAWSDGEPLTAEDVIWTMEARRSPEVAWNYAASQERIESFEATDDYTVVVRFVDTYPDRLTDLNEGGILPKHAWGEIPFDEWRTSEARFQETLVASGPFRLAAWRPQQEIVLEPNPHYYREGYPKLDRVVFRIIPERTNQLEQLLSGQIDFSRALRPSMARRVAASEIAYADSYWHRQYTYLVWNGCKAPFDDPEVRRALTLALDRQAMTDAIYGDYAKVAVSPILSSVWAFDSELEAWPFDPAEAERVLEGLGWTDSDGDGIRERDGERLSFKLSTNYDNRMRADAATMAQSQLARVGVEVELDLMEFNTLIDRNEAHDFDGTIGSWVVDTALDLYFNFHTASIATGQNYGCYSNADVDREIELARAQVDPEEKKKHLVEVQRLIHQDQPYTFLFELKRVNGIAKRVRDARPDSLFTFGNLEEWWLAASG